MLFTNTVVMGTVTRYDRCGGSIGIELIKNRIAPISRLTVDCAFSNHGTLQPGAHDIAIEG